MNAEAPVHFLLVDDLEENLLALEAVLRREGLVLLKARSGPEALELLLQYEVALALVDVRMPGMDGFELAELIRGTDRTRRIPLIFLTADGHDPQRSFRGYEAGAVDFIRKPIESDVLRSKANVFFELCRQRQELQATTQENARLLDESRKQAEALRDADRRKDEFLATLAHELRNPLAPIRNALEVMRTKGFDDPNLEWAREVIDRQTADLTRLVDDLLDVSRITTGKLILQRKATTLEILINRAIELSGPVIEANSHQLQVTLPETPIVLDADEVRLSHVFANILTNAAKYTDPGGNIRIRAAVIDGSAEVRVIDTGIGIPAEMLEEVFGLFTQVNRSLGRSPGGLGVGLSLVRRIIEFHGGTVSAESAGLGLGSTFVVRLPLTDESETSKGSSGSDGLTASEAVNARRRILIVDDNKDAAESFAMLLKLMGHETLTAHTGTEGLAAAREVIPDTMFLDIGLPGMDGYQLAESIRRDPQLAAATLVAVTGWGTSEDKRRAENAGFDFHLTKPIDVASVSEILASEKPR